MNESGEKMTHFFGRAQLAESVDNDTEDNVEQDNKYDEEKQ